MVLFQVNIPCFAVAPLEGDTPRPVDMNAVPLRFASERMEAESGNIQIAQRRRVFQCVEPSDHPVSEFRRYIGAAPGAKQLPQSFVAEMPYHQASVMLRVTRVKRLATGGRANAADAIAAINCIKRREG